MSVPRPPPAYPNRPPGRTMTAFAAARHAPAAHVHRRPRPPGNAVRAPRRNGRRGRNGRRAGRQRVRLGPDQTFAGHRGHPAAAGDVYRRDRRRRPAPPGVRAHRQRHRRVQQRLRHDLPGEDQRRRQRDRRRRRPRHPRRRNRRPRRPQRPGGRVHRAARRRQVRPHQRLHDRHRRPARHRHHRRQRLRRMARSGGPPRRPPLDHGVPEGPAHPAAQKARRRRGHRHRRHLQAGPDDLRRHRRRLRNPAPPPPRRRLPQRRPQNRRRGRTHRPGRGVLLRGRPRGVRPLPEPHGDPAVPAGDPLRGGDHRRRGAGRGPTDRRGRRLSISFRLRGAGPLLRERDLQQRGRLSPLRLQDRPDPHPERLRQAHQRLQGDRPPGRRLPRGAGRGRHRPPAGPQVPRPEQGQAAQQRGRGRRQQRRRRTTRQVPGGEPGRRQGHPQQGGEGRRGPRGGEKGPRNGPPQGRPDHRRAARKTPRLPQPGAGEHRTVFSGRRQRRRLRGHRPRQRNAGDPAPARQDPQRGKGPARQGAGQQRDLQHLQGGRRAPAGRGRGGPQAPLRSHHPDVRRRHRRLPHPHPHPHLPVPAPPRAGAVRGGLYRPAAAVPGHEKGLQGRPALRADPRGDADRTGRTGPRRGDVGGEKGRLRV